MNKVLLIGRITKDLVLKQTSTGKNVCDFTIAINRTNGDADFINCIVLDKQAENFTKYQEKGSLIGIDGSIRTETYEVGDKKRYKTFVLANQIEYLEKTEKNEFKEASIKTDSSIGEQIGLSDDDLDF